MCSHFAHAETPSRGEDQKNFSENHTTIRPGVIYLLFFSRETRHHRVGRREETSKEMSKFAFCKFRIISHLLDWGKQRLERAAGTRLIGIGESKVRAERGFSLEMKC